MPKFAVTVIEAFDAPLQSGETKVAEPVTPGFALIVVVAVVAHKLLEVTVTV